MPLDCPFCLSNNLLRTKVLFEDSQLFVTDVQQYRDCRLIIPKSHTCSLLELPDGWWKSVKQALARLELPPSYNISLNYGPAAGQTIPHLHFWVIPRHCDQPSTGKGLASLVSIVDSNK